MMMKVTPIREPFRMIYLHYLEGFRFFKNLNLFF